MNGEKPRAGIGALIKQYREAQRVTQRELADAAGMSVGTLRDLEQGRTRSPRWGTVEELVAVLCVGHAQRTELTRVSRALSLSLPGSGSWSGGAARRPRRDRGVRIDILGPLTAWRDGEPLTMGSGRHRAVLGLLSLNAGTAVHRDAMIDMLWGERPPASALAEVQGYVSRLRRLLGRGSSGGSACEAGTELVTTTGGCCYQLNAGPGQVDLAAFGELARQARETDPASACEVYEQALRLWRGDILIDVSLLRDHPAAIEAGRRRTEVVLRYAEAAGRADAAGRAGAYARVLPHLRALCASEPLNEQAHATLMTAHAATGQQAAALQVFAELRVRLDTELGVPPSPVLTQAHAQVLRRRRPAGVPDIPQCG